MSFSKVMVLRGIALNRESSLSCVSTLQLPSFRRKANSFTLRLSYSIEVKGCKSGTISGQDNSMGEGRVFSLGKHPIIPRQPA